MRTSNNISVAVRNVSKNYVISRDGSELHLNWPKRKLTTGRAVKPLSFIAQQGESIGILGQNGSGKSTLLSMIAGNESPTTGEILVSHQPSLLSVSAALQPHLSGVENVRLGLLAKGLTPEEAEELVMPVATWASIGDAIHRPLSTYSSGMAARLKFAISTAIRPKILLVDEALATGDSTFNRRAQERMDQFLEEAATVFIVSHSAGTIRQHCSRALWLHDGNLVTDLPAKMAVKWYERWSRAKAQGKEKEANDVIDMLMRFYEPTKIVFDDEAANVLN